jgi:hypothetical protein
MCCVDILDTHVVSAWYSSENQMRQIGGELSVLLGSTYQPLLVSYIYITITILLSLFP